MTKYISIDTETTGLDPDTSDLLEVGLVIFDTEENFKQSYTNSLRIVFVKEEIKGNIFAINMNINLLNEILSISKKFDEPCVESVIEIKTETLTTWYVDLREKNKVKLIFDDLVPSINKDALIKISYKLTEFLSNANVESKLNIVGKNFAMFDKGFLQKLHCFEKTILSRMRHRVLDVGSLYVDKTDKCIPDLNTCLKRAGMNESVPHTAVEDALLVVKATLAKLT